MSWFSWGGGREKEGVINLLGGRERERGGYNLLGGWEGKGGKRRGSRSIMVLWLALQVATLICDKQ